MNYWVALAVILFGSLGAEKALRLGARRARRATLAAFALVALAAAGFGWLLPLYGGTLDPVLRTLVVAGAALLLIEVPVPRRVALLALLGAFDVGGVASQLVWTQPASLASPARYPWAEKILAD
ncbi:hypothetical protein, partial [Staphylococcus epidermidis]|uniref:hypothetical protein n=1 Tax=Staphylococcus epidermidis TaxID=1282 RepID=UPI002738DCC6